MAKVEISQVAEVIKKHKVEPEVLREIVEDLNELTMPPEGEDGEVAPPARKKQFVIVLRKSDYDLTGMANALVGALAESAHPAVADAEKLAQACRLDAAADRVGWVVQIPEDASPFSTMDRVFRASYDFNASKRGRMLPVKSVGEALESASAKYFKEAELWVKTKLPVAVITTDNVLPKDEFNVERVDRRRSEGGESC